MTLTQYQAQYAALRDRLTRIDWISEGYVQDRGPGAGGPCYQWTRKVKGKTGYKQPLPNGGKCRRS